MEMMDLPENGSRRALAPLVPGMLFAVLVYCFFRWLWRPFLPFLLAALLAMSLQTPLHTLDRLTKHRPRLRVLWAVLLVVGSAGGLLALLCALGGSLLAEVKSLLAYLGDNLGQIGQLLDELLWDIRGFVTALPGVTFGSWEGEGILFRFFESADDLLLSLFGELIHRATGQLPLLFASFIGALPQIFLFLAVLLIAAVYLTADWGKMTALLSRYMPEKMRLLLTDIKESLSATLLQYGRAYLVIIFITMTELYLGFLILDVSYALGAAAVIAVIDLLPILGTGTVLLPWALLATLHGNTGRGIGLILLYIVIAVVRQIIEPRIVGKHIGIPPLLTLFSMYLGAKLFGVGGLFLCPMAAAVLARAFLHRKKRSVGGAA